jgi:predicted metal-binding protein
MSGPPPTIFVCVNCCGDDATGKRSGTVLYEAVAAELAARAGADLIVQPVECLSVCKRPCTIAYTAENKWTYVIGDLGVDANVGDIVTGAARHAESATGIVPWRERPIPIRRGVVARVPPLSFKPGDPR